MKLDTDPFPANINMINFEEVKVLMHSRQADSTRGKNVIASDEPRARMIKPKIPEPGMWNLNQRRWTRPRVKPTSAMLLEKYTEQQKKNVFQWLGGVKRERSPELEMPRGAQVR
jgi:hypothetical protein